MTCCCTFRSFRRNQSVQLYQRQGLLEQEPQNNTYKIAGMKANAIHANNQNDIHRPVQVTLGLAG